MAGLSDSKCLAGAGRQVIGVSERFCRPAEVDLLLGDASKARRVLDWQPTVSLPERAAMMAKDDYNALQWCCRDNRLGAGMA